MALHSLVPLFECFAGRQELLVGARGGDGRHTFGSNPTRTPNKQTPNDDDNNNNNNNNHHNSSNHNNANQHNIEQNVL